MAGIKVGDIALGRIDGMRYKAGSRAEKLVGHLAGAATQENQPARWHRFSRTQRFVEPRVELWVKYHVILEHKDAALLPEASEPPRILMFQDE